MRRLVIVAVFALASCTPTWSEEPKSMNVDSLPPVVVKTAPESGDTKVDASLTEIRITFSKKMQDRSWSFCGDTSWCKGKPHYLADGRTCVVKVELEPGKTYVTWLNTEKFRNFKDKHGQPAVPYLLVFETSE
jgi:hypothetical protein